MADFVDITTAPAGRNKIRIMIDAQKQGQPNVKISFETGRDSAENLVRSLCRDAGLPEPWKKG